MCRSSQKGDCAAEYNGLLRFTYAFEVAKLNGWLCGRRRMSIRHSWQNPVISF